MFGKEPAVGKSIYCKDEIWYIDQKNFTVGGVYKDFPENAQMKNSIYIRMKEDWGKDDWYSQNFMGYILLDSPESRQEVEDNFNKTFDFSKYGTQDKTFLHLIPVTDIYYTAGQYAHQKYQYAEGVGQFDCQPADQPDGRSDCHLSVFLSAFFLADLDAEQVGSSYLCGGGHEYAALYTFIIYDVGNGCFAGSDSGTVSGVVYDLFPAGIGPEREFRVIGFGTEIAYGPDRFPVRCLDRFDYRLLLHTTSE